MKLTKIINQIKLKITLQIQGDKYSLNIEI